MRNYKPGTDVPLTFDLVGEAPTSLQWRVLDENEIVLQDWLSAALPAGATLTLVIPAALTTLTPPALRGLRVVELSVGTAAGTYAMSDSAMLQGTTALESGLNTFQSYFQALFAIEGQPADCMSGWSMGDRNEREKALVEAHRRILQLPIALEFGDSQSYLSPDTWVSGRRSTRLLRDLAASDVLQLYPPLLAALRAAQVAEANDLMDPDSPRAVGNSGLTSLTVGDSSQTWRQAATGSSKPMDFAVCPRAMAPLRRWLRFGAVIGRS